MARGVPFKGIKTRQPTIKRRKKENEDKLRKATSPKITVKRNVDSRDTTFDRKGQMDST